MGGIRFRNRTSTPCGPKVSTDFNYKIKGFTVNFRQFGRWIFFGKSLGQEKSLTKHLHRDVKVIKIPNEFEFKDFTHMFACIIRFCRCSKNVCIFYIEAASINWVFFVRSRKTLSSLQFKIWHRPLFQSCSQLQSSYYLNFNLVRET